VELTSGEGVAPTKDKADKYPPVVGHVREFFVLAKENTD